MAFSIPAGWNYFVTDVTVTTQLVHSRFTLSMARPVLAYRLERWALSNGRWRSVTTIDRTPTSRALGSTGDRKRGSSVVATIVDDGDGSPLKLLNANGVELPHVAPPVLPASWPVDPVFKARAAAVSQTAPAKVVASDPNWLRRLILLPSDLEARQAEFTKAYGAPVATIGGVDEFRTVRDSLVRVVHVDSDAQAILDIQHIVNDATRTAWEYSYNRQADGTLILNRLTATSSDPAGGGRRVTVMHLNNVHLEKRG